MIRWAALIKPWGEQKGRVNPKLLHVYTKPAHTRYNLGGVTAAGRHDIRLQRHSIHSSQRVSKDREGTWRSDK